MNVIDDKVQQWFLVNTKRRETMKDIFEQVENNADWTVSATGIGECPHRVVRRHDKTKFINRNFRR